MPHFRAIRDRHGRIIAVMTHNTDVSNSWERETDDPAYFDQFSVDGYALGRQRPALRHDALTFTIGVNQVRERHAEPYVMQQTVRNYRAAFAADQELSAAGSTRFAE